MKQHIHHKKVNSDLIRSAGWNNALLQIRYTDGTLFNYGPGVPESIFQKLFTEDSPGEFWLGIRDKFDFKQMK